MTHSLEEQLLIAKELAFQKLNANHHDRYQHTLSVADKVHDLIISDDVLLLKTLIAAYMHDTFKYPHKEDLALLNLSDIEELETSPFLLHAILAANYYLKYVGSDLDIYNSIRYHITSAPNSDPILENLFIADFIEENRTYPNCLKAREIYSPEFFYSTLYFITNSIIKYTKKEGFKPTDIQVRACEYYYNLAAEERNALIIFALEKVRAENIELFELKDDSFTDFRINATVTSKSQILGFYDQLELLLENSPYEILKKDGLKTEWLVLDVSGTLVSLRIGEIISF